MARTSGGNFWRERLSICSLNRLGSWRRSVACRCVPARHSGTHASLAHGEIQSALCEDRT
eukprot:354698-Chlamydomonas_euryale.AAC.4